MLTSLTLSSSTGVTSLIQTTPPSMIATGSNGGCPEESTGPIVKETANSIFSSALKVIGACERL